MIVFLMLTIADLLRFVFLVVLYQKVKSKSIRNIFMNLRDNLHKAMKVDFNFKLFFICFYIIFSTFKDVFANWFHSLQRRIQLSFPVMYFLLVLISL